MTLSFITKSIKGVLTMKKTVITIISIILGIALVFSLAMLIRNYIVPVLTIANSQKNVQETFLCSSESPDGKFNLEAYRTEPGATVDYSVRVYMINGNQKEIIYTSIYNMVLVLKFYQKKRLIVFEQTDQLQNINNEIISLDMNNKNKLIKK